MKKIIKGFALCVIVDYVFRLWGAESGCSSSSASYLRRNHSTHSGQGSTGRHYQKDQGFQYCLPPEFGRGGLAPAAGSECESC